MFIRREAFFRSKILNYVFYLGLRSPSNGTSIFISTQYDTVHVTNKYKDKLFCGYKVSFPPTSLFSYSDIFTISYIFSSTLEFSPSGVITSIFETEIINEESKSFINSLIFSSNDVEETKSSNIDSYTKSLFFSSTNIEEITSSNIDSYTSSFTFSSTNIEETTSFNIDTYKKKICFILNFIIIIKFDIYEFQSR